MYLFVAMKWIKRSLIWFAACAVLLSCSKDQLEKDSVKIEKYLSDNNLTAQKTADGLYYIVEVVGPGDSCTVEDEVTVHYKGYTLDGDIFDSSYERGEPSTFPLNRVITGWQLGIPLFTEGGKGTLLIPSELAYGKYPPQGSGIKRNEVLIFDVELIEVL